MPDRRFSLAADPKHVFPGSELDNIRLYHDDIVVQADDTGIHVVIPDSVDEDTLHDATCYLTGQHGFTEVA